MSSSRRSRCRERAAVAKGTPAPPHAAEEYPGHQHKTNRTAEGGGKRRTGSAHPGQAPQAVDECDIAADVQQVDRSGDKHDGFHSVAARKNAEKFIIKAFIGSDRAEMTR